MHVHISLTDGSPDPVVRAFRKLSFDRLYLLAGITSEAPAVDLGRSLEPLGVTTEIRRISGTSFGEVSDAVRRICEAEGPRGCSFSLGIAGGTPVSAAAMYSCAYLMDAEVYDGDIPLPIPRVPELGEETRSVLERIGELEDTRGRAGIKDLSECTGRTKQSLNYQLNILRREGLVEDVADPKDKRFRSIGLTDKGRMVAGWA